MHTTEERLIWLGAGVMSYAILQIAGLYYGVFFILGLGLMLWGLLRERQDRTDPHSEKEPPSGQIPSSPPKEKDV